MSGTHPTWIQRASRWGLLARGGALLALFTTFLAVVGPLSLAGYGQPGLLAAALAALICLLAGWLAMVATEVMAPPSQPAAHLLIGMMIRMSLPLLACLVVIQRFAWLAEAGFAGWLVAAFCLGLTVETLLTVARLQAASVTPASRPAGTRANGDSIPGQTANS